MNKHRGLKTIFNNITFLLIACILSTGFTNRASITTGTNAGAIQSSTSNQLVYFPVSFGTEGIFQHSFGGETYLLSYDTILDKAKDVNKAIARPAVGIGLRSSIVTAPYQKRSRKKAAIGVIPAIAHKKLSGRGKLVTPTGLEPVFPP